MLSKIYYRMDSLYYCIHTYTGVRDCKIKGYRREEDSRYIWACGYNFLLEKYVAQPTLLQGYIVILLFLIIILWIGQLYICCFGWRAGIPPPPSHNTVNLYALCWWCAVLHYCLNGEHIATVLRKYIPSSVLFEECITIRNQYDIYTVWLNIIKTECSALYESKFLDMHPACRL